MQPKWNLKLSYSKAFIDAPYMYRKINLFLLTYFGYPELAIELEPESLHSFQLTFGANRWLPGLNFEVNGFYNRARDLIIPNMFEHQNTGSIDTYGIELSANYQYRRFSSYLAATWQDVGRTEIYDYEVGHALNTPVISANAVLAWQVTKNLKLNTHIDFQGLQHAHYLDILSYSAYSSGMLFLVELEKEYQENPTQELEKLISLVTNSTSENKKSIPVSKDIPARVHRSPSGACRSVY